MACISPSLSLSLSLSPFPFCLFVCLPLFSPFPFQVFRFFPSFFVIYCAFQSNGLLFKWLPKIAWQHSLGLYEGRAGCSTDDLCFGSGRQELMVTEGHKSLWGALSPEAGIGMGWPVATAPPSFQPIFPLHRISFCLSPSPEPRATALSKLYLLQRVMSTVKT